MSRRRGRRSGSRAVRRMRSAGDPRAEPRSIARGRRGGGHATKQRYRRRAPALPTETGYGSAQPGAPAAPGAPHRCVRGSRPACARRRSPARAPAASAAALEADAERPTAARVPTRDPPAPECVDGKRPPPKCTTGVPTARRRPCRMPKGYRGRMHFKRVIPCLDVDAGRVVKGVEFVDIRDAGDPVELAAHYDSEGADELVFLDITATHEKRDTIAKLARRTADEVFVPFTIGGGIRSVTDAQAVLDAGADKVSVNSAALQRPELLGELADVFGAQCVVLAIDAKARRWPAGDPRLQRAYNHGDTPLLNGHNTPSGEEPSSWEAYLAGGRTSTGRDVVAWAR